jgi:hypothetical protein
MTYQETNGLFRCLRERANRVQSIQSNALLYGTTGLQDQWNEQGSTRLLEQTKMIDLSSRHYTVALHAYDSS